MSLEDIIRISGECIFSLLCTHFSYVKDDLIWRYFDFCEGQHALSLALTSKTLFNTISPLINKTLIFRAKVDGPYKYYNPQRITIWHENAKSNIPSHLTHLLIGGSPQVEFDRKLPSISFNSLFSSPSPSPSLSSSSSSSSSLSHCSFPSSITHLSVMCLKEPLPDLPIHLTNFNCLAKQIPTTTHFPSSVKHISIPMGFFKSKDNKQIYKNISEEDSTFDFGETSLTHLTFSNSTSPAKLTLSPNITHLSLSRKYSPFIDGRYNKDYKFSSFPSSLKFLEIECISLFYPLPPLPSNLEEFHLIEKQSGSAYSIPIFPSSLTSLTINLYKPFTFTIPQNLKKLSLSHAMPEMIIPPSLTHFSLLQEFNNLPITLPTTLTHLRVNLSENIKFPPMLTHLYIKIQPQYLNVLEQFPPTLLHLTIKTKDFNNGVITINHLPSSLIYLKVHANAIIDKFPQNMKFLQYVTPGPCFTSRIIIPPLPSLLTHLIFQAFSELGPLPLSLKYLTFDKPLLSNTLPPNLIKLVYCGEHEPPNSFPEGLLFLQCIQSWFDENEISSKLPPMCFVSFTYDADLDVF